MLATSHEDLKAQVLTQCLEIFPEAQSVILWGGSVSKDFSVVVNDVDVIIEIAAGFGKEVVLAERLKTLVQTTQFCRLDPSVYLSEVSSDEPLEFIAPFGFYKANPFIPYLIQQQHEVLFGKSRLLEALAPVTLKDALLGQLPQVMGALKRLRMDAQVEADWAPLLAKHKSYLFVIARTYFAFEHDGVGSKQESLRYLVKSMPQHQILIDNLSVTLDPKAQTTADAPNSEAVLSFVRDMETALQAAKRRMTTH